MHVRQPTILMLYTIVHPKIRLTCSSHGNALAGVSQAESQRFIAAHVAVPPIMTQPLNKHVMRHKDVKNSFQHGLTSMLISETCIWIESASPMLSGHQETRTRLTFHDHDASIVMETVKPVLLVGCRCRYPYAYSRANTRVDARCLSLPKLTQDV